MQTKIISKRTDSQWIPNLINSFNVDHYLNCCSTNQSLKIIPTQCVDYFSNDFTDDEIMDSWKMVQRLGKTNEEYNKSNKKRPYLNERLVNISWRNWTKLKNNLGLCSPYKLDWNKDLDYYCLYGPSQKINKCKF